MSSAPLRWGNEAPNDPDIARDRLLDAAEVCFRQYGISKTIVEDIAKQAQVSRATVYRYFAGRDAVVSGVILRETARYLERVQPRVESKPDLGEAILEFVAVANRAARRDETIGLLFNSDEGLNSGGIIEGTSVALFEMVADFLRPIFVKRADEVKDDVTVDDAAEWILRTSLSFLTVSGPRRRSDAGLNAYLRQFLLPSLVRQV